MTKLANDNKINTDIEILRAYSVIAVLYEHMGAITGFENSERLRNYWNGWTGVDLFFVISGFVIYRSLHDKIYYKMPTRDAIRQVVAFWIRRFSRLAPAAWFWLLVGVLLIATYTPQEIGTPLDNVTDLIASFFNFENFHVYGCRVSQSLCGGLYPHYWSLSLETQFYMLLPLLIIFIPSRYLTIVIIALIALQLPMRRAANSDVLGWFVRTDGLAWGILIARLSFTPYAKLVEPSFLSNIAARSIYTFVFLFALGSSQYFWREPFFVGFVAFVGAALVFAASYDKRYIATPPGMHGILVWIGQRSYSIYVSHMIVYKGVRELAQTMHFYDTGTLQRLAYVGLAFGSTLAAAAATYEWLEKPLRRKGRNHASRYLERTAAPAHDPLRPSADEVLPAKSS